MNKSNLRLAIIRFLGIYLLQIFIIAIFSQNIALEYLLGYLIPIIIMIIIWHNDLRESLKNLPHIIKKDGLRIIFFYILFILGMYITNFILYKLGGTIAANEATVREELFKYPIIMSISSILLAPLYEELIFRYNFKEAFKDKRVFYALTSLLFAIAHILSSTSLLNLLFIVPYLFLSLAFGYGIYRTDNIGTSFLVHVCHNLYTVIVLFIV